MARGDSAPEKYKPPAAKPPSNDALRAAAAEGQPPSPELAFLQAGATMSECEPEEHDKPWTWSQGDGTEFRVRVGPNYSKHGKKEPSLSQMYDAAGSDIYRSDNRIFPISSITHLPKVEPWVADYDLKGVPPIFVLNTQLPNYPAAMMGSRDDGPTLHIVLYYHIRRETAEILQNLEQAPPAYKLWHAFSTRGTRDDAIRNRFKLIGRVENWKEVGLPSLLESYNSKPTIIYKTGELAQGKDFLEVGINVHIFRYIARRTLYGFREQMHNMVASICGTVEGRADDELPERVVFVGKMNRVDGFHQAAFLSADAIAWLQAQAKKQNHNQAVSISRGEESAK